MHSIGSSEFYVCYTVIGQIKLFSNQNTKPKTKQFNPDHFPFTRRTNKIIIFARRRARGGKRLGLMSARDWPVMTTVQCEYQESRDCQQNTGCLACIPNNSYFTDINFQTLPQQVGSTLYSQYDGFYLVTLAIAMTSTQTRDGDINTYPVLTHRTIFTNFSNVDGMKIPVCTSNQHVKSEEI